MKLFLDDERMPKDVKWIEMPLGPWVIVRNFDEFVSWITTNGLPEHISFDHDLGQDQVCNYILEKGVDYNKFKNKTGFCAAKWLVEYCLDNNLELPDYTIHSMNPIGKDNIQGMLFNFEKFKKQS